MVFTLQGANSFIVLFVLIFMEDISVQPKLHVFICINDRTGTQDEKPSCGPGITKEMVKEIKQWIIKQGLTNSIYCTKVQCLGFCNPEGGVIAIYPKGRFVKGIKGIEEIKQIIQEEWNAL